MRGRPNIPLVPLWSVVLFAWFYVPGILAQGPSIERISEFNGFPTDLRVFRNKLVFLSQDSAIGCNGGGRHLIASDGTTIGTAVLSQINNSTRCAYSFPVTTNQHLFEGFQNELLMIATDGVTGLQLWKTDGQETSLVKVIFPDDNIRRFEGHEGFEAAGSFFFFPVSENTAVTELWKTDGTPTGTVRLSLGDNVRPVGGFFRILGKALTLGYNRNTGVLDSYEIGSDGVVQPSTIDLGGVLPGSQVIELNGKLLFKGSFFDESSSTRTSGLWETEGTAASTQLVIELDDLFTCADDDYPRLHQRYVVLGGNLIFASGDGGGGCYLWSSDGTTTGTTKISESVNPGWLTLYKDEVYYSARSGYRRGIYASNGSTSRTVAIRTSDSSFAGVPGIPIFDAAGFTENDGLLYFWARNQGGFYQALQLYVTDGTQANTTFFSSIEPFNLEMGQTEGNSLSAAAAPFVRYKGELYFAAEFGGWKDVSKIVSERDDLVSTALPSASLVQLTAQPVMSPEPVALPTSLPSLSPVQPIVNPTLSPTGNPGGSTTLSPTHVSSTLPTNAPEASPASTFVPSSFMPSDSDAFGGGPGTNAPTTEASAANAFPFFFAFWHPFFLYWIL